MIELLFKLLCGHAVGDFALQGEFIAKHKSRHVPFITNEVIWPYVLGCHGLVQGLMVYLATQSVVFGITETILHCVIDYCKCEKMFGFHVDQWLHIGCKVAYVIIICHR